MTSLPVLRRREPRALVLLFATLLWAPPALAGNALLVPSQHATIQAAVNVAGSGDVIIVSPGGYPAFTVSNKHLSIVPAAGSYDVLPQPNGPEITVINVAADKVVTITGARIVYNDLGGPAVRVANNPGAVRFDNLVVEQSGHMFGTSAQACVEVDSTSTFWMLDSSIWGSNPLVAYTTFPMTAGGFTNNGVSGLQLRNSHGIVENTRTRGYQGFDPQSNFTDFGGDGLRAIGPCNVWLLQTNQNALFPGRFQGALGTFGGNAVHQVLTPTDANLIRSCGGDDAPNLVPISLSLEPGGNAVTFAGRQGGFYGFNNGNGSIPVGGGVAFKTVKHCNENQLNECSIVASTVSVGSPFSVDVRTRVDRQFLLLFSATTLYTPNTPFSGRSILDGTSLLATDSGITTGQMVTTRTYMMPGSASLIGLQISIQAAYGPVGGPLDNLGLPAMFVVTP